jgi:hypothetical protein
MGVGYFAKVAVKTASSNLALSGSVLLNLKVMPPSF